MTKQTESAGDVARAEIEQVVAFFKAVANRIGWAWTIGVTVGVIGAFVAAISLGANSDSSSGVGEPGGASATTNVEANDATLRHRVQSRLDGIVDLRAAYLYRRFTVTAGDVLVYTRMGADTDGKQAANGICAELWGLRGEEAPKGITSVRILGVDRYGNDTAALDTC